MSPAVRIVLSYVLASFIGLVDVYDEEATEHNKTQGCETVGFVTSGKRAAPVYRLIHCPDEAVIKGGRGIWIDADRLPDFKKGEG